MDPLQADNSYVVQESLLVGHDDDSDDRRGLGTAQSIKGKG
jgi:hypothetical protein